MNSLNTLIVNWNLMYIFLSYSRYYFPCTLHIESTTFDK
eukprot:UN17582